MASLFCGCGNDDDSRAIFVVRLAELTQQVSASGTINALATIPVGNEISGRVRTVFVDRDVVVRKDQLLAVLEPAALEAQLAELKAKLDEERAYLEKAEIELRRAEIDLQRTKTLFEGGNIPKREVEASEASCDITRGEKNARQARIVQLRSALQLAEINLTHTEIRSPISGVVLDRKVEEGQIVTASFLSATLFVIASDLSRTQLSIDVAETDIGLVRRGQNVTFIVDAYPGKTFRSRVKEIHLNPTIKGNAVYYTVIAFVENPDLLLRPGMTVEVNIEASSQKNVLVVAGAAIKERGNGTKYVEILQGAEIQEKAITLGSSGNNGLLEVTSGLQVGDKVIISRE